MNLVFSGHIVETQSSLGFCSLTVICAASGRTEDSEVAWSSMVETSSSDVNL